MHLESIGIIKFLLGVFIFTGVFKETEQSTSPVIRHFSRTFLVVAQVIGFCEEPLFLIIKLGQLGINRACVLSGQWVLHCKRDVVCDQFHRPLDAEGLHRRVSGVDGGVLGYGRRW